MKVISLFSGIGGFELAAEWMGWESIVSCEINTFGASVLKYYWPNAYHHDDVKTLTYEKINEELTKRKGANWRSDELILVGGFPCQPYSGAGNQLGTEDDRHLWPEMLRIIREVRPRYVVGENVRGLTNWNDGVVFDEVQANLEAEGYEVLPFLLPAASVGAPHERYRIWFVAYAKDEWAGRIRDEGGKKGAYDGAELSGEFCGLPLQRIDPNASGPELQRSENEGGTYGGWENRIQYASGLFCDAWREFPTQPPLRNGNDGLPPKLDGITVSKWTNESIKAGGNAIVPQVAYQIFKAIQAMEDLRLQQESDEDNRIADEDNK